MGRPYGGTAQGGAFLAGAKSGPTRRPDPQGRCVAEMCTWHPAAETALACGACGAPACDECLAHTPVGLRCAGCAHIGPDSPDAHDARPARSPYSFRGSPATFTIIALTLYVFAMQLGEGTFAGPVTWLLLLDGPLVAEGEVWRLLTTALVHSSWLHLIGNMVLLLAGALALEQLVGSRATALTYVAAVLGGSAMALTLAPDMTVVGASGGVLGVLAAIMAYGYAARVRMHRHPVSALLLLCLVTTVLGIDTVSVGAHIGGFAAGIICGLLIARVRLTGGGGGRMALALGSFAVALFGLGLMVA